MYGGNCNLKEEEKLLKEFQFSGVVFRQLDMKAWFGKLDIMDNKQEKHKTGRRLIIRGEALTRKFIKDYRQVVALAPSPLLHDGQKILVSHFILWQG